MSDSSADFFGKNAPPPVAPPVAPPPVAAPPLDEPTIVTTFTPIVRPQVDVSYPVNEFGLNAETLVAASARTEKGPSWVLLSLALACPLVVGIGTVVFGSTWWRVVGWAAVSVLGFGFLMLFTNRDIESRASNAYVARDDLVAPIRIAIIAVTLILALWNAWLFADWFARLPVFLGWK